MKKIYMILAAVVFLFTSCTSNPKSESSDFEATATIENEEVSLSEENPLLVDESGKTVFILAKINGKFLNESTRHFVVSESGKAAEMAIFTTPVKPNEFYDALTKIGAKPGDNMTPDNASTTTTEGSKLKVSISFDGKNVDLDDAVIDSNNNPIDMRFSGNMSYSDEFKSGCISCLDSCYVGITSNASYPLGAVEERKEVEFKGNQDVLPEDGENVIISYKLAE